MAEYNNVRGKKWLRAKRSGDAKAASVRKRDIATVIWSSETTRKIPLKLSKKNFRNAKILIFRIHF